MNGGYDDGYSYSSCFWGTEPGSFVRLLNQHVQDLAGLRVLDAGCGEGKNAAFLASKGAHVHAVDISEIAIRHGREQWPNIGELTWSVGDVRDLGLPRQYYDIVVAYGLLHCMQSAAEITTVMSRLKQTARPAGYFVLCAFNERRQELAAHPGFNPSLLSDVEYVGLFRGWQIIAHSDSDITESHPHNKIEHTHSLTRILARKNEA